MAGHDHNRVEAHGRSHGPAEEPSLTARLRHLVAPHSHDSVGKVDDALETSEEGVRAVTISLAALAATAIAQAAAVAATGSVALLGDTLHNVADALTAVPLGVAFVIGRRAATRRYTYGYGRAEDLAGIAVVVTIAASAALAGYESIRRLLDPRDVEFAAVVAAAGVIGVAGDELIPR
jgi:divalent metal cation (Fe/Co/Zn/Cd) transporter